MGWLALASLKLTFKLFAKRPSKLLHVNLRQTRLHLKHEIVSFHGCNYAKLIANSAAKDRLTGLLAQAKSWKGNIFHKGFHMHRACGTNISQVKTAATHRQMCERVSIYCTVHGVDFNFVSFMCVLIPTVRFRVFAL